MAKADLIGGTLWESYSQKVNDRMLNPRHLGEITEAEAAAMGARLVVADWGAEVCGDAIRAFWAVEPKTSRIRDAKFKTFGCGAAIAVSSMVSEMAKGKTIEEALKMTKEMVAEQLGGLPKNKMHCSNLGADALHKAIEDYQKKKGSK